MMMMTTTTTTIAQASLQQLMRPHIFCSAIRIGTPLIIRPSLRFAAPAPPLTPRHAKELLLGGPPPPPGPGLPIPVGDVVRRRFSVHVSNSGSIDSPMMQSMEKKIKEQLNADQVTVKDAYGDGRHVSINVVSSAFEGQSAVNRQRMVYKAIWEELQSTVHAVDQMTTRTPSEAAKNE
ncbi:hypothetical protein AAC387_Pa08g0013 [Persea americana]